MLKASENPSVSKCSPNRLLSSGYLYQSHLEPGPQPRRLDWALTFSGRHGRKRLVAFITTSEFPVSESERQWPSLHGHHTSTIILAPHQPSEKEAERERGRDQKTPRKPVTLGHWNCEDLSRRFQVASLSAAKPISVACKPLLVWALVNKRFARFYAYKALDCPVKKVRWMKNRVTGFIRFWSFNCFFCHGLFTERLCWPRQLWCVSHRLCGLPQGVKCHG